MILPQKVRFIFRFFKEIIMAFFNSVESIFSIVLIIALGFYLRKCGWFADSFSGNISKLIMNIALPASIFVSVLSYLTRDKLLSLSGGLVYGAIAVGLGYVVGYALVKIFKVRAGRRGLLINMIANANTIFIGLPLNVALFGEVSLPYFLVYYVLNTISTWTIGTIIMNHDSQSGETPHKQKIQWSKLLPAPLVGFIVALIFLLGEIPVPNFVHSALSYLGGIVTPLSLIYIGIMLCDAGLSSLKFDRDTWLGLTGRFILAPLLMFAVIFVGQGSTMLVPLEIKTLLMQSAVPALALLPVMANEAKGDVVYATNLVTTSTLLFILVAPFMDWLLSFI